MNYVTIMAIDILDLFAQENSNVPSPRRSGLGVRLDLLYMCALRFRT